MSARQATILTHRRSEATAAALETLRACAREAGVRLRFDPSETVKHGLEPAPELVLGAPISHDVDLCIVLGGDGTILTALRTYAGVDVPVYAVNFGEVGFLATIDPDGLERDFTAAFAGGYDILDLPGIRLPNVGAGGAPALAMNDVSVHRKPGMRVADLSYGVADEEIGRVRCDGLVVATPAGSTGYNLANGGPVLAWGVEGYVVSFIAPHSLSARALVVAPDDRLVVHNVSIDEPVDIMVDGRPTCELAPGADLQLEFVHAIGKLAQLPGATFYHRLRERFGRLAR